MSSFFKEFWLNARLRFASSGKNKGVLRRILFQLVFFITFPGWDLNDLINSHIDLRCQADISYCLLHTTSINWRKILLRSSINKTSWVILPLSSSYHSVWVIGTTSFELLCNQKKMESLSRIYDNVQNRFTREFYLFTKGLSDEVTFFLLFSRQKDSHLYPLRKVFNIFPGVHTMCFDSWLTSSVFMSSLITIGLATMCLLKKTSCCFFSSIQEKSVTFPALHTKAQKHSLSQRLISVAVPLSATEFIPARILCIRFQENPRDWIAFLPTDISLKEKEILTTDANRWDIEIFFKVKKSSMLLGWQFETLNVLLIDLVILSSGWVLSKGITGRDAPRLLYIDLVSVVISIILNLLWIPHFGIMGAALASTVSYKVSFVSILFFYCRLSGNHWTVLIIPQRDNLILYWRTGKELYSGVFKRVRMLV
jgi:hypothetical protein